MRFTSLLSSDPANRWEAMQRYIKSLPGIYHRQRYAGLEQYVMFIGYPRSGHSILGSILDAHPDMVMAHELDAMYYFNQGYRREQVFYMIEKNEADFNANNRQWMGYDYNIPGQWQGKVRNFRMIGDKCGGRTTRRLLKYPSYLATLHEKIGLKTKIIHIIRNPYDNITTRVNRSAAKGYIEINERGLKRHIKLYARLAQQNQALIESGKYDIYTLPFEQLVANPTKELEKLLKWLGLSITPDYLAACDKVLWNNPKKRRFSFPLWNEASIAEVADIIDQIPFLQHYRFAE